jgi:GNAT superfamily N-acetyltransferase
MHPDYRIERAALRHLAQLPAIEAAAARLFLDHGLPAGVLADATRPEEFRAAQAAGQLWVALRGGDEPVGFAHVELVDGGPHLEELDVHPDHGRRGVGAALVRAVCDWSRQAGFGTVTLTTFRDVPWNAPFYRRLGFTVLAAAELSPELAQLVRRESAHGLDPERRVAMRFATRGR